MKYNQNELTKTSRFLCLVLRHKPSAAHISLDEHGWAIVKDLIVGVNKTHPIDMELLEEIVRTDEKNRYSFNEDHTKIRANQGHSIPVDVELKEAPPPEILYHGTGEKYEQSILTYGLLAKSRLYVHLSAEYDTALKVGARHGQAIVFQVDAFAMHRDGYRFFVSENGVWLCSYVPNIYLTRLS